MNWINTLLKPASLAALLLMLGSGLASAAEPVVTRQAKPVVVQSTALDEAPPAVQTENIRLAWDRVGAMA